MPDIPRVTTPLNNPQDQQARTRPQAAGQQPETNIQNIPDHTRVTNVNQQSVFPDRQENKYNLNFESNYDKFTQLIRALPDATQLYRELFLTKTGFSISSGLNENFVDQITQYMELLKMSDADLLEFLKSQLSNTVKFSGPFFDIMREILSDNDINSDTTRAVLNMLRSYDSLTSSGHILKELISNLENIASYLPQNFADELKSMISLLIEGHANGENAENLDVLKGQIMPFLASYIYQSRNFGSIRDLITLFTQNLARYENGSIENFIRNFYNAMNYDSVASRFQNINFDELEDSLKNFFTLYNTTFDPDKSSKIYNNFIYQGGSPENPEEINNLIEILNNISQKMSPEHRDQLNNLISQLAANDLNNENANISIVENDIVPFLSSHIENSSEQEQIKELLAEFAKIFAQYKNGKQDFPLTDIEKFQNLFTNNKIYDINNTSLSKLIELIALGVRGDAGIKSQSAFENILQSMLINESVYMPLLHAMIPAEVGGRQFFSEIWVDPDSDENNQGGKYTDKKSIKMLIKFDIKNVGYFELILLANEYKVDLQLFYPESLSASEGEIRSGIRTIASRNNLTVNSFLSDKLTRPKSISEVFPKIHERNNMVNIVV